MKGMMQIFSVTEHLNSLNKQIETLVKFVDDVEVMRARQQELAFIASDHDRDLSLLMDAGKLVKEATKLVDDFLAKRNKGGLNDAPR